MKLQKQKKSMDPPKKIPKQSKKKGVENITFSQISHLTSNFILQQKQQYLSEIKSRVEYKKNDKKENELLSNIQKLNRERNNARNLMFGALMFEVEPQYKTRFKDYLTNWVTSLEQYYHNHFFIKEHKRYAHYCRSVVAHANSILKFTTKKKPSYFAQFDPIDFLKEHATDSKFLISVTVNNEAEEQKKRTDLVSSLFPKGDVRCEGILPNSNKKCGSKNVSFHQQQRRSRDEPPDTFHICEDCGNRWDA